MPVAQQIDDFEQQELALALYNDDLGWNDTLMAGGELSFGVVEGERENDKGEMEDGFTLAEFIRAPINEKLVEVGVCVGGEGGRGEGEMGLTN